MRFVRSVLALIVALGFAGSALAGKVEVKGVHLCCGACVTGVSKALDGVTGVSGVASDRESKVVTFTAADDKAAQAGIDALADAGFHGAATHDGNELKFPASGAKDGAKASEINIDDVHLCCAACVKAVDEVVSKVDGVSEVTSDRQASSVKVTGENVSVEAVVKALNDAGFHATIKE
jgi:mercuric ion binding protein